MKRFSSLYQSIYDFESLHAAYKRARKGKRYRDGVLSFSSNLEERLIELQNELIWKTYRTSPYRHFKVYEPKERLVKALPFRDRVAQHALVAAIEPIFEKSFIYHSYGCRVGKGVHRGSQQLMRWLRETQRKWGKVYCLKADVSKFFPSINHDTLLSIIKRKIKCPDTLWLIEEIVRSSDDSSDVPGVGIPVGNLTSQLFANIYLDQLDHYVKERMRVKYYIRYMDDFVILHHDKKELRRWLQEIEDFLFARLQLKLNPKTDIFPISRGVDFLGYRTWPTHRLVRKSSIKRMKRKMRKFQRRYAKGAVSLEEINRTVQSWLGHVKHADSYNLRKRLFSAFPLVKGEPGTKAQTQS
ncbi:RNA-dependent DNA polymerase [Brevibacillus composti]|uniref:RNA-dependent DNA polymerase n=1 Tax=Brevibacillus composti TaxID=2796470 RepID=A0ABX7Z996_9BACL|nr:reverse transcriptase domain-containing protein [Brevibacillus composti]QUO43471.1 RNA-dependent DNA polymerase [Brevibacillus composti]